MSFRPHGSRELYYTEDGEDSMAESVTTVESNHTGTIHTHTHTQVVLLYKEGNVKTGLICWLITIYLEIIR